MSSSSTLYNHHNHSNGNSNGTTGHIINVSHSGAGMQQQHRNSPLTSNNNNNSFIYTSQSSLAPSPTISLISSSSSSPTSSSSSPTQLTYNSNGNKSNSNIIFGNNSSNISAAKKTAALQSIAASIARSQQLSAMNNNNNQQQMYGQQNPPQNSNLANKILALTLENNGVASSIVKSNTNIYYNSKVDTAASKAIHYCTQCSNIDCKAIHKSLTKPLNHNNHHSQSNGNGNVNLSQSQSLPSPLLSQPLSNVKNGSNTPGSNNNTPSSSQQQQLARKFLTSKLEQLDKQTKLQANQPTMLPKTPIDQTKQHNSIDTQSQQNNQFNKLLGANVNFIFERRYPLVQLNSNFFNISASNPNGGSTESLINFINNAGQSSLLSPMTTSALLGSGSNFHNHSSNRNILQYRGGNHGSQNLFSDDDNNLTSSISSPSVSPKGTSSFPLPISPPSSHFDPIKSPPKSTSFSINVNNSNNSKSQHNISPPSNTSSPSSISSSSSTSLPSASNNLLQKQANHDEVNVEMTDSFPSLNRLDNLRYKNIMFLDQFNKDDFQQRSQSPRDTDKSKLISNSPKNGLNKNEKEIQIQRITTSPQQPAQSSIEPVINKSQVTNNNKSNGSVNYIDLQVINSSNNQQINNSNINNNNKNVSQPIPTASQTISTSPLPTTNIEFSNSGNKSPPAISPSISHIETPNKAKSQSSPAKTLAKITAPRVHVPQFHFPTGKPDAKQFKDDAETMKALSSEFRLQKDGKMFKENFTDILKLLGIPKYWKTLLFRMCTAQNKLNFVTYANFESVWSKLCSTCHDQPSLFLKLISSSDNTIVYDDWEPLMQDIVDTHPGLKFLHDHKEFHTRYIKTVIARIYYTVNRSWSGKITLMELKRSNFLSVLESLEYEDDINLIKDYFSYEHFYVIYCKFWELDKDHDLFITKEDLYRHNNFAITPRVIDRIFSGTVIRGKDWREGLMSYYDFVWFLISEEDKRNATSIEYWFRILDLDGDGVLSMYELEYFYNEQIEQMRERQIDYMPFTDLLCQILDLVKPTENGKIHLKDLKQCKMTNIFFDTFINLEKYLEYEQRDPFSNMRDLDGPELSDWEKYAADEYENLVSEDVNADNQDLYNNYEDDFEEDHFYNNSVQNNNGMNMK